MSQYPDQYGRHQPYPGEWHHQEESTGGEYPDPYVRPVGAPIGDNQSYGAIYGSPAPAPRRRRRGPIVVGIVAVLVLGSGGIAYAWHASGSTEASNSSGLAAASASSGPTVTGSPSTIAGTPGGPRSATATPDRSKNPGKDSGVALCAEFRDSSARVAGPSARPGGAGAKNADYQSLRRQFTESRYADIREAGTRFVDTLWLMPTPTIVDAVQIAKDLARTVAKVYTPLAAACANHGVKLPPLTGG